MVYSLRVNSEGQPLLTYLLCIHGLVNIPHLRSCLLDSSGNSSLTSKSDVLLWIKALYKVPLVLSLNESFA